MFSTEQIGSYFIRHFLDFFQSKPAQTKQFSRG
jgi:hypothetical protein